MKEKIMKLIITFLFFIILGCTHTLEVKNLTDYKASCSSKPIILGINTNIQDLYDRRLVDEVVNSLQKYVKQVIMAYSLNTEKNPADVVISIDCYSKYRGSWVNFFINWPGYLIWCPAWNGYVYKANYDFQITLTDPKTGNTFSNFNVPIHYKLRQAEFDRTWTEIGWLEWGVIPFIGGIFFTKYDPDITSDVVDKVSPYTGSYIASRILQELR